MRELKGSGWHEGTCKLDDASIVDECLVVRAEYMQTESGMEMLFLRHGVSEVTGAGGCHRSGTISGRLEMESALTSALENSRFACFMMIEDDLSYRLRITEPKRLGGYSGFSRAVVVFFHAEMVFLSIYFIGHLIGRALRDPELVWGERSISRSIGMACSKEFWTRNVKILVGAFLLLSAFPPVFFIVFTDKAFEIFAALEGKFEPALCITFNVVILAQCLYSYKYEDSLEATRVEVREHND